MLGRDSDFTEKELTVLADVDRAIAAGLQLKRWWEQKEANQNYAAQFDLVRTFNRPDRGVGFFDVAPVNGQSMAVMGLVQEMLFDQPKQAAPELVRNELREFILRYFMRVSDFQQPSAFTRAGERTRDDVQPALRGLCWCPEKEDARAGFGYSQLFFKRRETGEVGRFPREERFTIIDLRELVDRYEWIVCEVSIFNFSISFRPLGAGGPEIHFPVQEQTYIVLTSDFIQCRDDPHPDRLGEYGFGYALLKPAPKPGIFGYGPGYFQAGFQTLEFAIDRSGASHARLAFVANRPDKVLSLDINPIDLGFRLAEVVSLGLASRFLAPWRRLITPFSFQFTGFDPITLYINLANFLTGGQASDYLCTSLETLEKNPMLLTHFMQHYQMLAGALMTWRNVQSWTDAAGLPRFALTGLSS